MSEEPCERVTPADLKRFDLFKDDDDAALSWLAERFKVRCFEPTEIVANEGDPAAWLAFVMEGELQISRPSDPSIGVFTAQAGEATGVLPFSRMKQFLGRVCASKFTRVALMDTVHLRELVYRAPNLGQKLIGQMTDRTREFTRIMERNSKMLALGKLSAGLAHELNNPASAVVRSATKLRELILERRKEAINLRAQFFPQNIQETLEQLSRITKKAAEKPLALDDLERSDMEAELSDWLEHHGLDPGKASDLIHSGITVEVIQPLAKTFDAPTVDKILNLLLSDHQMLALVSEVEEAARRMSQLVQDVKSYSYMDTAPGECISVEEGILTTLRMFQHQLKHGITVKKELAPALPKIRANGNELNQVWTNLIDNAVDAMRDVPSDRKVLTIKTSQDPEAVIVEIGDSGTGIPADLQGRIFEPFFTTKGVGEGTGLGLDIVQRIVRKHRGSIYLESEPGHTVFHIRLPKNSAQVPT